MPDVACETQLRPESSAHDQKRALRNAQKVRGQSEAWNTEHGHGDTHEQAKKEQQSAEPGAAWNSGRHRVAPR